MSLLIGLIGLPNAGKSTLFNALTEGAAAASNYPFCTVDPNVGVVEVPDPRLAQLGTLLKPRSCTPTAIEFVDIAGLVSGASQGEGLGNRFLEHIRRADALVHVLRCFADPQVSHVEGRIDPLRDRETVEAELMLADLETVERALSRLDKIVRTEPRSPQRLEFEVLRRVGQALQRGTAGRDLGLAPGENEALKGYNLLTMKPVLYVANIGEAGEGEVLAAKLREALGPERVLAIAARLEAELAQLPPGERTAFQSELGLAEAGISRLILAGYRLLDLITFYTLAHGKLQAWQLSRGTAAPAAAGRIHSDMENGFIRAEVAAFEDVLAAAGMSRLREEGKLRTEGKDYLIRDGDVVHFLFRP